MEEKGAAQICPYCSHEESAAPESLLHLPPGTVLQEKYLIGCALGQGGFGITYLAWDLNLNIKLAIKEYLPQELATRTTGRNEITVVQSSLADHFNYGLEKFLEEARILARFNEHPNVVSVRDFFKANGTAYIVMNYIEGMTLKEYLDSRQEPIHFEQALNIFMPVLDALKEVHAAGILHRDISPDNLLIDAKGRVVLIDFGAARQAMGEKSRSMSVTMKAGYSPEEQYRSRGELGPWTDIYALAATFYQSITGLLPPESLDRLADDTIVKPSQLGIVIDSTSEQALLKALAVRSKERYQVVGELQDDLVSNADYSKSFVQGEENNSAQQESGKEESDISKQTGNEETATDKKFTAVKVFALVIFVGVLLVYGIGAFDFPDTNNVDEMSWRGGTYSGEIENNTPHGQGILENEDGDIYEGEFKDGEKHGTGTMLYSDGAEYEGEWENSKPHGLGTEILPDGTKYEGEFEDSSIHGKGSVVFPNGDKYEGDFKDGAMHGEGVFKFEDGAVYEGEFKDDEKQGMGTIVYSDGRKYEGEWENSEPHGMGIEILSDETKYEGEFEDGKPHGTGTVVFPSGNKYVGEHKDGKRHGEGTFFLLVVESMKVNSKITRSMAKGHFLLQMATSM